MLNTILGSKGKMSQMFVGGMRVPATKIMATASVVTQVKSGGKDGYFSVQLGFGERKTKNMSKAEVGHLKGAVKENKAPKFLSEVRLSEKTELNVGDKVNPSEIFKVGDKVAVTGVSKGKGWAGVVKRWHFEGGPKTHGQSDRQRAPGSIGTTTTPGRVLKGKHMGGRMGGDTVTIKNLHILSVDPTKNEILVSGQIPGKFGDLIILKKISSGSLAELEHEKVTVVEGEAAPIAEEGATPNA